MKKEVEKTTVKAEVLAADGCESEEKKDKNEAMKAEGGADDASAIDVLEQLAQKVEEISRRLAVLEGEGKKADDEAEDAAESGDQIAARLNSLYARLTGDTKADEKPVVQSVNGGAKVSKKAKMEASFERSKKIDLKSFM